MSRTFRSPNPEGEIARRLASLERKIERIFRAEPTVPSSVTTDLTDLGASVADVDGHTHGLADHVHLMGGHSHGITTVIVWLRSTTGPPYIQVGGSAPADAAGFFLALSAGTTQATPDATDVPVPTDTDPWVAP